MSIYDDDNCLLWHGRAVWAVLAGGEEGAEPRGRLVDLATGADEGEAGALPR